ncbi:hypothetical protein RN607_00740 [Demequina capsici]|uniref:Uncharacterized protein n=1 Tax=Demequina capsici TaxID=3075620 RepID=A0AA96FFM3_9MICO|nr:hypothetical protein [Demequina sp. PMTSA13]WNM27560.1 hypothetical protein RN607_00740 [Demequina sp. PMTSA13]
MRYVSGALDDCTLACFDSDRAQPADGDIAAYCDEHRQWWYAFADNATWQQVDFVPGPIRAVLSLP